jgi:hypothetical protein
MLSILIGFGGKCMTKHDLEQLLEFLGETLEFVGQLVRGLSEEDLRWKPSDNEFSILENICHLNDIEREGYRERIKKLLSESEPFLPDIDGGKLARERNYNAQDPAAALHAFTLARMENIKTIKNISPDQLSRSGMFENVGPVTLEELLLKMKEHDEGHRKELSDLNQQNF